MVVAGLATSPGRTVRDSTTPATGARTVISRSRVRRSSSCAWAAATTACEVRAPRRRSAICSCGSTPASSRP